MPRVMEIATPLGEDVLLFHGMHAREELGRLSEYQLDLLSPKDDINLDDILGKNVTVKLALPDDSDALLQRLRDALLAGRDRSAAITATTRVVQPVALVPDAHGRLPHLPGDDRAGHRQEGVRRSRDGRFQVRADRQRTGSGPTACSTARPTSTSSAG